VLSALIYSSSTTVAPAQGAEVIALERAQFVADGAPRRAVLLPHTWARGGLGNTGRALYRFEFHLARTPGQPWACRHRACRRATWCA
jgi:hypothetical protein